MFDCNCAVTILVGCWMNWIQFNDEWMYWDHRGIKYYLYDWDYHLLQFMLPYVTIINCVISLFWLKMPCIRLLKLGHQTSLPWTKLQHMFSTIHTTNIVYVTWASKVIEGIGCSTRTKTSGIPRVNTAGRVTELSPHLPVYTRVISPEVRDKQSAGQCLILNMEIFGHHCYSELCSH